DLERRFGVKVVNFCYPAGHYDQAAIAELRRAGYRGATTELPGLADRANPYTLARLEITGSDGLSGFADKVSTAQPQGPAPPPAAPRPAGGMRGREADGVRWLGAELPEARAAFSTRLGGVSEPPFDTLNLGRLTGDPAVSENRHRLAGAVGVDPRLVLIGRQVHGAEVRRHQGPTDPPPVARPSPRLPAPPR